MGYIFHLRVILAFRGLFLREKKVLQDMICCFSAVTKCPSKRTFNSIFSKECLVFGNIICCPFKMHCLVPYIVPLGPTRHIWSRQRAHIQYGLWCVYLGVYIGWVFSYKKIAKGLSSICFLYCLLRGFKTRSKICNNGSREMAKGFFSDILYVYSYFLCMTRWGNVLSHREQFNGSSPVWILW